jgi:hypothetical protein
MVRNILLKTGRLQLLPDHKIAAFQPPAWKYFDIWMDIRENLRKA